MWIKVVVALAALCFVQGAKDVAGLAEYPEDEAKTAVDQEKWRALNVRQSDADDWQPADDPVTAEPPTEEEPTPRRRRPGRKRKRPPQTYYEPDYTDDDSPRPTNRRPQRLDQQNVNWREEMLSEPFRPMRSYSRRRQYPKYEETTTDAIVKQTVLVSDELPERVQVGEKVRDPYTALEQTKRPFLVRDTKLGETDERTTTYKPIDLKALLKQSGDISLSELLQQKNISLADLLKGEQRAISALTAMPAQTDNPRRVNGNYKRISTTSVPEVVETDATEPYVTTTEKRIFVPPHPKLYTSVNYKPYINNLSLSNTTNEVETSTVEAVTERASVTVMPVTMKPVTVRLVTVMPVTVKPVTVMPVTVPDTEKVRITVKARATMKPHPRNSLPPTLAKLRNAYTKTTTAEPENYPTVSMTAFKIDVSELFGLQKLFNKTEPRVEDNKIAVDVKLPEVAAKQELMEVLNDTSSKSNLTRILKLRNMTLEELIEMRERGSSQRHLADIFHNQTKEPEPSEDEIVKNNIPSDIPLLSPSLFDKAQGNWGDPHFIVNELSRTRESRQNQISVKYMDDLNLITSPETSTKANDIEDLLPLWRQAFNIDKIQQNLALPNEMFTEDSNRIDEIKNTLSQSINGAFNIDLVEHNVYSAEEDTNEFPYGVRSAVIASAIIIGISLFVFFTIFIIFKWTQKRRKHLTYNNTYSATKIRTPIIQNPYQRRIFDSLLNATLGRKKRLGTISSSEPHSIQDYLWDSDKKPFQ